MWGGVWGFVVYGWCWWWKGRGGGFNLTSIFIIQTPRGENTFTRLCKALFNNGAAEGRRMGALRRRWSAPRRTLIKCAIHSLAPFH